MTVDRPKQIEERLREALNPVSLLVKDQSHLHAGHAGAQDGKGHFEVRIVSEAFSGLSIIKRHRLVYESLGGLMETDIHALSIKAQTTEEAS